LQEQTKEKETKEKWAEQNLTQKRKEQMKHALEREREKRAGWVKQQVV
jgi:hypothetical protein